MIPIDTTLRETIAGLSLFEGATPATVDYLCEHFVQLRYRPGACVWLQDSEAFLFAVVVEGEIEVIRSHCDGSMQLYLVGPGQPAGFAALHTGARNDCSAIARADTVILATSGEALLRVLGDDIAVRGKLTEAINGHECRLRGPQRNADDL